MKDEDIHVGDVLYVKEWDELLREGRMDINGNIEITNHALYILRFLKEMRKMCGAPFTVKKIHRQYYGLLYESEEHGGYGAVAEMLCVNPNEEIQLEVATDEEIKLLFC